MHKYKYRWKNNKFYAFEEDHALVLKGCCAYKGHLNEDGTSIWKAIKLSSVSLHLIHKVSKFKTFDGRPNPAKEWINLIGKKYFYEAIKYNAGRNPDNSIFRNNLSGVMLRAFYICPEIYELSKRFPFCAVFLVANMQKRYSYRTHKQLTLAKVKQVLKMSDSDKITFLWTNCYYYSTDIPERNVSCLLPLLKKFTHKTIDIEWNAVSIAERLNRWSEIEEIPTQAYHLKQITSNAINMLIDICQKPKEQQKRFAPYIEWLSKTGHLRTKRGYQYKGTDPFTMNDTIRLENLLAAKGCKFNKPKISHKNILAHHDYLSAEHRKIRDKNIVFKQPPVLGTTQITPILDSHGLIDESKTMHHCVSSYKDLVLNGTSYIYHVANGEENATLELKEQFFPYGIRGWKLNQLRGVCNQAVSKETQDLVKEWAEAHNIETNNINESWF
jgi:hypothetical protein